MPFWNAPNDSLMKQRLMILASNSRKTHRLANCDGILLVLHFWFFDAATIGALWGRSDIILFTVHTNFCRFCSGACAILLCESSQPGICCTRRSSQRALDPSPTQKARKWLPIEGFAATILLQVCHFLTANQEPSPRHVFYFLFPSPTETEDTAQYVRCMLIAGGPLPGALEVL